MPSSSLAAIADSAIETGQSEAAGETFNDSNTLTGTVTELMLLYFLAFLTTLPALLAMGLAATGLPEALAILAACKK